MLDVKSNYTLVTDGVSQSWFASSYSGNTDETYQASGYAGSNPCIMFYFEDDVI